MSEFRIGQKVEVQTQCGAFLMRGTVATVCAKGFYSVDVNVWKEQNENEWTNAEHIFGLPQSRLVHCSQMKPCGSVCTACESLCSAC